MTVCWFVSWSDVLSEFPARGQEVKLPCSHLYCINYLFCHYMMNRPHFYVTYLYKAPSSQTWRNSKVEISIYHYLSIYLPPGYRERRLLLIKKKWLTLYGPMASLKFQCGPMTTYSGVIRETG